jgi:hypothetical protein
MSNPPVIILGVMIAKKEKTKDVMSKRVFNSQTKRSGCCGSRPELNSNWLESAVGFATGLEWSGGEDMAQGCLAGASECGVKVKGTVEHGQKWSNMVKVGVKGLRELGEMIRALGYRVLTEVNECYRELTIVIFMVDGRKSHPHLRVFPVCCISFLMCESMKEPPSRPRVFAELCGEPVFTNGAVKGQFRFF